jgi:hypothetical protein
MARRANAKYPHCPLYLLYETRPEIAARISGGVEPELMMLPCAPGSP